MVICPVGDVVGIHYKTGRLVACPDWPFCWFIDWLLCRKKADTRSPTRRRTELRPRHAAWQLGSLGGAAIGQLSVDPPHRLHEGVTYLGIGYGTFILDHTPVRGFLDAEVSVDTQSQRRGSATVESLNRMEKACLEA